MPSDAEKRRREHAEQRERYAWLKANDAPVADRVRGSRSKRELARTCEAMGIPPWIVPGLTEIRMGGKKRLDTEEALQRRRRYRHLRDLGLGSMDATNGAGSVGRFRLMMRRLGRQLPEPASEFGLDSGRCPANTVHEGESP